MAKRKIKEIQGKRIQYSLNHVLVTENCHFDSWTTLCEYVMDIAIEEAKKQMSDQFEDLVCKLSDEIIDTAEEYESA